MDGNHPKNKDPRPKRAKDKDNPYTIFTVGLNTEHPRYYLEFTDGQHKYHSLEISWEVFALFDRFELEDKRYLIEALQICFSAVVFESESLFFCNECRQQRSKITFENCCFRW